MNYLLYLYVLIPLAVLDAVWLFSTGGMYRKWLGHLFAPTFNFTPAIIFYLLYAFGITYFVLMPSVKAGSSYGHTLLVGALLGLFAYAVYDLTNHATMRDWPLQVTIIDLVWGTILTALVSGAALYIYHFFK